MRLPCMVKGTADSGMRKDAAYTFIPQSAVTVAAPPRISIAVTITATSQIQQKMSQANAKADAETKIEVSHWVMKTNVMYVM